LNRLGLPGDGEKWYDIFNAQKRSKTRGKRRGEGGEAAGGFEDRGSD